jgi:hypothetical protein
VERRKILQELSAVRLANAHQDAADEAKISDNPLRANMERTFYTEISKTLAAVEEHHETNALGFVVNRTSNRKALEDRVEKLKAAITEVKKLRFARDSIIPEKLKEIAATIPMLEEATILRKVA